MSQPRHSRQPGQLRVLNLRVAYRDGFALGVPRLDIPRGAAVSLIGPTGAGKSTLLRLMAGLETPQSGEIHLDGALLRPGDRSLAARRRLGIVFQSPRLLARSVRENVAYGRRLRGRRGGRSPSGQVPIVDSLLERLGLGDLQRQAAGTLSGGQVQLVALARALAIQPDVLLLDEPTANLDPARVARVEQLVRETQAERGMTVVWATHNLFQARRVSDRVVFLLDGQIVETNRTEAFFDAPAEARSCDFIEGKMIY